MTNYITYNCLQNASCIRKYFQVLWFWGVCWKLYIFKINHSKINEEGKQDGRGVGGHGVHLSPQTHQEYTFRHRSACRTASERRQEYLPSSKEYTEPHKTVETMGENRSNTSNVGLWLPARERTLTAVNQRHLLFLCFDLLCSFFWIFSFFILFLFFLPAPPCCSCQVYWHYEI